MKRSLSFFRYHAIDLSAIANARKKNSSRETTGTLKAWLLEHKKNPYPTKGEKIMLAILTKMTLTQVSTWFANARRRLKKENKMTWTPKSKPGDKKLMEEESGGNSNNNDNNDCNDEADCNINEDMEMDDIENDEENRKGN